MNIVNTPVINTPGELADFAEAYGLREDWHEPDEQGITAYTNLGHLDNAGFPMGSIPAHPEAEELTLVLNHGGMPVARVLVASLLAWACDAAD